MSYWLSVAIVSCLLWTLIGLVTTMSIPACVVGAIGSAGFAGLMHLTRARK